MTASRQPTTRPRGFGTLFITDLWERFGFYGMQAILVLYAAAPASEGGLGLPLTSAAALFGAYLGITFMMSLAGGWVGDRLLGARRAVLIGGIMVTAGYAGLATPGAVFTVLGLSGVSLGTALLKPNLTSLLSMLYGRDSAGREAGISLFYVGIQISALTAPLVTGFLGETINWHLGFAAAAVAMLLAVIQFTAGNRYLGDIGSRPGSVATSKERRAAIRVALVLLGLIAVMVLLGVFTGTATAQAAIIVIGLSTLVVPISCFAILRRQPGLGEDGSRRLGMFLWVLFGSSLFWLLVGQDGALLNLFARDSTDRSLLGIATVPASWLQSATPLFILLLAPLFAYQWTRVGSRISLPVKFATGLLFAGLSFVVIAVAAALAADGDKVSPLWLITVYFMHACGELVVAAVGISAAVDVVPQAFTGQIIGLWWLFSAMGAGLSSQVVHLSAVLPDWIYYLGLGLIVLAYGGVLLLRRRTISAGLRTA
ncbi:MAG: peptide MFS transporter [Pseudonocardiaceae bacterium]